MRRNRLEDLFAQLFTAYSYLREIREAYLRGATPESCSARADSGLIYKYNARLERFARDKRCSLPKENMCLNMGYFVFHGVDK